jgi:hypothetical protein
MSEELTQERLREVLDYDPGTGVFRWTDKGRNCLIGKVAGSTSNVTGYCIICVDKKTYSAHRLVWLHVHGFFPPEQVDHINRDRTDNRLSNLRLVSNAENRRNVGLSKYNTSGVSGVGWSRRENRWVSRIGVEGKTIYLIYTKDFFEACCARLSANNKYGFHPNHGR